jgi:integrase
VLHVHRTLSQALAHAVKTGVLFRNPAEQVKPPRPQNREIAILTKPEIATLLRAGEGSWIYLVVLVGVTTGMRRGELLGLRWPDIDFGAARLTVNQSLERVKGKTVFKSPKTKGSRRTITLPALTVEALARISHTIFARSRGLRDELIRVSGTRSLVAPEDASGAGTLSGLRVAAND